MKIGTKSVLFGGHQFLIHPWFVAWAWWKLYGFPLDPRLWVAFFVHDIGYFGKPNMDGVEGETHVEFGAWIMMLLFDWGGKRDIPHICIGNCGYGRWGQFSLFHSRFYAKKHNAQPSRLCIADKLAIVLTPRWIYLPLVRLTGEINEYMKQAETGKTASEMPGKYSTMNIATDSQKKWHGDMCEYLRKWVDVHKDGNADTWTPDTKKAVTESGVWQ